MLTRILTFLCLLLAPTAALAQSSVLPYYYNSGGVKVPVGSSNPLPISGSFSASLSPFTPGLSGARATPITVTIADSSGNLPTNTGSVIVYNVGANPMYCNVNGIAATVADQYISSAGGWFNFGVPAGTTTLHCIATGGSTTANAAGGTGLGAGTGGGSGGGGGGGAITAASGSYASGALSSGSIASGAYASGSIGSGAVASGAFASGALASGAIAAGAQVDLLTMRGTVAAGTAAANSMLTGCIYNSSPITMTTGQGAAVQCSVNGYPTVVVSNTNNNGQAALGSSSPVAIAKNSGTGSTVAGAAVGTAGSASAEVVTVQGIASGTPMPVSAPAAGLPSTPGTLAGGATFVSGTTAAMTGTTSTSLIPLVSSQRIYVTRVKCNNSSGTATLVQIRDGSAGTVLDTLAAGATYGGEQGTGSTPLFWTTAGTALFAQNVTTGASVICTASGYSG